MAERESDHLLPDSLVCVGTSMHPTLKVLDVLYLSPYTGKKICRGDVIAFQTTEKRKVTHRVTSITPQGFITKGDNNLETDLVAVQPDDVLGQVIAARRNKKALKVYGGSAGFLIGKFHNARCRANYYTLQLIRPVYYLASKSGIFRLWLPRGWKPSVLSFNRPEGVEMQLRMGQKLIGRYNPETGKWSIKPPFRLFIDEVLLPAGK